MQSKKKPGALPFFSSSTKDNKMNRSIKIAIAGSGMIVPTALECIREAGGYDIVAISVRPHSLEKGLSLAEEWNIGPEGEFSPSAVYTDYGRMLSESGGDFVYIAIVNSGHFTYAKKALMAGKNVILEKPFCTKKEDADELAALAKEKGLYIFEAISSLHNPNFSLLQESLPRIGDVSMVQCNFSQYSSRYDAYLEGRVSPSFNPQMGGGSFMDLGIYSVDIVTALFGAPSSAEFFPRTGFNGVDTSSVAVLKYPGMTAVVCSAKDSGSPSGIIFQGNKGWIKVEGTPNEMAGMTICVRGEGESVSFDTRKNKGRLTDEFISFRDIFLKKDYGSMLSFLGHTLDGMTAVGMCRTDLI